MRRSLSLLIALLVGVAGLCPARLAAQDDAPAPVGYTVRGTVVNAVTGQPVARALVSVSQQQAMLTDSNGQFRFESVPPGNYGLSVTKPGYLGPGSMINIGMNHGFTRLRPQPEVRFQTGPDVPAVTLRITPLATIAGHITLSTADPADGIQVQAFARRIENGHPHWVIAGMAQTRSDGSFRIGDLEAGNYRIATMASIERPGLALNADRPVWGFPSLYYPGTTEISGAGTLHLDAGQQGEADIALVRQRFFPVVGLVHSSSDAPANFEILDSGGRQTGIPANFDRREGIVHAEVPNGTWTMEAHAYGQNPQFGSTTFQVNGAPASLAINLAPVPSIPIVIRRDFESSNDDSLPMLIAGTRGPGFNLELIHADEMRSGVGGSITHPDAPGDSDWSLQVNEPGRYWVQVQDFPPAYVSSITSGGIDLGSHPLVIVPGSTPPAVEVTLRNDGGTISGIVGSENPGARNANATGTEPQVWIYAIPQFSTAEDVRNVMPNPDGHFSFYAVAPGSYRVVACDAPQEIDSHSPEGLAAWAGKGQVVTVDAGGTASAELEVVHMAPEGTQ